MAKLSKEQIIESLKEMSMLEISDLVKAVEETFGVSAAAPVAAVAAQVVEAPTSVTISLADAGANKVAIIKLLREATGLGLMEAKTAVEKGGAIIKENIKPEEANEIKKTFEASGAKVKIE
ncbi:MAG: 50S ribosomal protein L7/L12 [Mycoplasmataceae bacterium]|jgi:large subunit ribosomal protein L7/L12|nr:50S ribosomal protein L7/L12 [Mycoplasmataceae bacterium]